MKTDTHTILEYEPAHQPYFEQLYRSWFTRHFRMEPEAVDEFVLKYPEKAILEKGGAILVALQEDRIAGFVALKKVGGDTHELTKMIIGEEYRGKGLGEALCKAAIGKARNLGIRRVVLYSHSSLGSAINLYRKLGFTEVPLEPGIYSSFRCDIKMEIPIH
jgi:ribosomal protein S18 acetylase RimI-like enzyme